MKIEAVLAPDRFRYDQDHQVSLRLSLVAGHQQGRSAAPEFMLTPVDRPCLSLGTERCDPRSPYATNLVVTVRALAGHKIERVVSEVDDEERGGDGSIAVGFGSILAEERRALVLIVRVMAQKGAFPRKVNVFYVKVAFDAVLPDGARASRTAEAKVKAQFIKAAVTSGHVGRKDGEPYRRALR